MAHAHVDALKTRHSDLDHRIAQEAQRPMPDTGLLQKLKKLKLRLKEQLARQK